MYTSVACTSRCSKIFTKLLLICYKLPFFPQSRHNSVIIVWVALLITSAWYIIYIFDLPLILSMWMYNDTISTKIIMFFDRTLK